MNKAINHGFLKNYQAKMANAILMKNSININGKIINHSDTVRDKASVASLENLRLTNSMVEFLRFLNVQQMRLTLSK